MQRISSLFIVLLFIASLDPASSYADGLGKASSSSAATVKRIADDIQYLASDELKGRQPGTPEMKLAEDRIVECFKEAGLKPGGKDGYLQTFNISKRRLAPTINPDTTLMNFKSAGGENVAVEFGQQFVPMTHDETYSLDGLPVVFVGYGINASREHNYNDFLNVDVEGKAVVLIRGEPQQQDAASVFDGKGTSRFSFLQTKVDAAVAAKAAAIIMVNDSMRGAEGKGDELAATSQFGRATRKIPFLHLKRAVLERVLAKTPIMTATGDPLKTLAEVEAEIDATLSPVSQTLPGWKVNLAAEFVDANTETSNVVGIIEGEGPHADETIVIGAHYDHLGMGNYGSRSRDAGKAIHNGADDNASGTAAVMELARRFSQAAGQGGKKPARRIVFVCFTGEELGLYGSKYYVDNPVVPLGATVAMINFDMIGYLRKDTLEVFGWNTAAEFVDLLDAANKGAGLKLGKPAAGFGGSDHLAFNAKQIPNLFFNTGLTQVFHTPEDDFEGINVAGAARVIDFTEAFINQLLEMEAAPKYVDARPPARGVRLGVMVAVDEDSNRLRVDQVIEGSIANRAGIKAGDQIMSFNKRTDINSQRRLVREIQRGTGKKIEVILDRDGEAVTLNFDLK